MIVSHRDVNWHVNIPATFKRYRDLIIQCACNLVKFARNLKGLTYTTNGCGDVSMTKCTFLVSAYVTSLIRPTEVTS